ncbi:MAG: hypothetical protein JW861_03105 [Bacteroidales bacterium]|nr:hypothetical protein [Bacteroidales bacterium]
MLEGLQPKVFRQGQVKRNIDRLPENFMFELNEQDC